MAIQRGHWHGYIVSLDGDDPVVDLLHPTTCSWSIEHHPRVVDSQGRETSPMHFFQTYTCDVDWLIREMGPQDEGLPTEPGFYWVQLEHEAYGDDYTTGVLWLPMKRPRIIVESDTEAPQ